ncbi:hypothetical protein PLESTF_001357800 [Pleodorina starrii]|nr:hypothetical protein PLESTF_001357800 [Pleodorina starrii]
MLQALVRQTPSTFPCSRRFSTRRPSKCTAPARLRVSRSPVQVSASLDSGMGTTGMDPELQKSIDDLIATNTIVVFMKGNRQFPQCGFSNTVVQILNTLDARYETVDILADPRLRSGMKVYSQWPTFPQVYINGEFFGGCDIMIASASEAGLATCACRPVHRPETGPERDEGRGRRTADPTLPHVTWSR